MKICIHFMDVMDYELYCGTFVLTVLRLIWYCIPHQPVQEKEGLIARVWLFRRRQNGPFASTALNDFVDSPSKLRCLTPRRCPNYIKQTWEREQVWKNQLGSSWSEEFGDCWRWSNFWQLERLEVEKLSIFVGFHSCVVWIGGKKGLIAFGEDREPLSG